MAPYRLQLSVLALCVGTMGCFDPCGNSVLLELPSPDKQWTAVLFERDCGATTSYSTQVSLVSRERTLPSEAGNIFVSREQLEHPGIAWLSRSELEVSGIRRLSASTAVTSLDGISIRYVEEPPFVPREHPNGPPSEPNPTLQPPAGSTEHVVK